MAKHSLNVSQALAAVHDASPEQQRYEVLHDANEASLADVLVSGYEADPEMVATAGEFVDTSPASDFEAIWTGFCEHALELAAACDGAVSLEGCRSDPGPENPTTLAAAIALVP